MLLSTLSNMFTRAFAMTTFVALTVLACSSASASNYTSAYVSGLNGSDANLCDTPAIPCASISGALAKTGIGGTIICLDPPASESSLSISKSMTIDCRGGYTYQLSISVPSSDPIQSVQVKGLIVDGLGSHNAIVFIAAGGSVILDDMIVRRSSNQGIVDARTSNGRLNVRNTIIDKSVGPGIVISGTGVQATFENVVSMGGSYGIAVANSNRVTINRSTMSYNSVAGVEADGGSLVVVDGSTISYNNVGILSGSAIRLSNNNIEFNTTAVNGPTGTFGNNRFSGNGSDGTILTPVGASSTDLAQK